MKNAYKQLVALNNETVKPLIDNRKLLYSFSFENALQYSVECYDTHGDSRPIIHMLEIFTDRDCQLLVVNYIGNRTGVLFRLIDGEIKLSKQKGKSVSSISLKVMLEQFAANKFKIKSPQQEAVKAVVGKKRQPVQRVDALDSWARLPGSYGSGKRY